MALLASSPAQTGKFHSCILDDSKVMGQLTRYTRKELCHWKCKIDNDPCIYFPRLD